MTKIHTGLKGFISSHNSQLPQCTYLGGEALSHVWGLPLTISVGILLIKVEGFY